MEFDTPITEITYADAERVDGVFSPANGVPFLMIKGLDSDFGDMLKSIADDTALTDEQAFAKAAHVFDRMTKATFTKDERDKMADNGQAMPDGSYPIANESHLDDAIHAVGRGNADHNDIRAHIVKRAKAIGAEDKIPDNWKADGSMKKAADPKCKTCGDTGTIMDGKRDCPDCDMKKATADDGVPGSPAWEQADADNLKAAASMLAQAGKNLELALNREQTEVNAGQIMDMSDVFDLSDAISALDLVLGITARIAFSEEAESAGTMAKAGKRLSGKSVTQVATARNKASEMATHASELAQHLTGLLGEDDPANEEDADPTRAAKELEDMDSEELKKELDDRDAKLLTAVGTLFDDAMAKMAAPKDDGNGAGDTDDEKDPKDEVMTKALDGVMAKATEAFGEMLKGAIAPIDERLSKIENEPQHGGPILNADAVAGSPFMKALAELTQRGQGGTEGQMTKGQSDLVELNERFAKASSDEDRASIAQRASFIRLRDGIDKTEGALV